MSAYLNNILIHLWLGFMLIVAGGVLRGIRLLARRQRMAQRGRN